MPLPDLISFSKIQFMQRFVQNFLSTSFNDTWIRNAIQNIGENEIQLRNWDQLQHVHSNLVSLDLFPLFSYPKIWQDFQDENIKIIRKTSTFDQKLKFFLLDDLPSIAVCNRLLCPACLAGPNGWMKKRKKKKKEKEWAVSLPVIPVLSLYHQNWAVSANVAILTLSYSNISIRCAK